MNADLTVWWPQTVTFGPWHSFTSTFCSRESRTALQHVPLAVQWLDYSNDTPLASLVKESRGSLVLCLSDPTVLLNPYGLRRLWDQAHFGARAVGPVFSDGVSPQDARLPFPYWDPATYWEVAQHLADQPPEAPLAVPTLDPRCFLVWKKDLVSAVSGAPFPTVSQALQSVARRGGLVDPGAIFHVFGPTMECPRDDLVALVPETTRTILDVGCATGLYGKTLRQCRQGLYLVGVEPDPNQAQLATVHYDRVYAQAFEQAQIEEAPFDLVNCGDVLEHFLDPWRVLSIIRALLRPEGHLVLSVPNVGHWTIVRAVLQGHFDYIPAGLLCRDHLRWFTEASLRQALDEAGFVVEVFHRRKTEPTPQGRAFLHALRRVPELPMDEESLLSEGFLVRARVTYP